MGLRALVVVGSMLAVTACAHREDTTPPITVAPGFAARIAVMDGLRHYGSPRRFLPHVTVEEVDESELEEPVDTADAGAEGDRSARAGSE